MKKHWTCKLGFHTWETVRRFTCRVPIGNAFTGNFSTKVDGETLFQKCSTEGCNCVRGVVDIGVQTQKMDVGFLARSIINSTVDNATDPDLNKWALL